MGNKILTEWSRSLNKKKLSISERTEYRDIQHYINYVSRYFLGSNYYYTKYALYYMSLYVKNTHVVVNTHNIRKLFFIASTATHKFWFDDVYSNKDIAKSGKIDLRLFNILELAFMQGINWQLFIEPDGISDDLLIKSLKIINLKSIPCPKYTTDPNLYSIDEEPTTTDVDIVEANHGIKVLSLESKCH